MHEFSLYGCQVITKPEAVITMRRYEKEMQFRCLIIGSGAWQCRWHIDRPEILFRWLWHPQKPIPSRRDRISTSYWRIVITTSSFLVAMDPNRRFLTELYTISWRSMFHWLWRSRKPISTHWNCISISYLTTVITTSGFVVALHPDMEKFTHSRRTIENFMSIDVPLTLASSKTYIWTSKLHFYLIPTHSYNHFRFLGRYASK
jgi:hypothetical protein